jgi:transcriptional regulator with XRE-family HTH domain
MELLSVIRRWAFRDRLSIREISRRTNLSRNTIRKYLRSDVVEPAFKVPDRPSKLDAFADKLSAWLKLEGSRPRKQKRTVKQLHADLVALGFDGSYGRVSAFARAWKTERQRECQSARKRDPLSASKKGSCAILVQAALVLRLRISDRDDSPRGHQSWAEKSHLCHLCWPSPRF